MQHLCSVEGGHCQPVHDMIDLTGGAVITCFHRSVIIVDTSPKPEVLHSGNTRRNCRLGQSSPQINTGFSAISELGITWTNLNDVLRMSAIDTGSVFSSKAKLASSCPRRILNSTSPPQTRMKHDETVGVATNTTGFEDLCAISSASSSTGQFDVNPSK